MTAYNELYLDDAMNNLGDMMECAILYGGYDPDTFFTWFISSGLASMFEKGNPKYVAGMSGLELADAVLKSVNLQPLAITANESIAKGKEYWTGWILAYYQWITEKRFEDIVPNGLSISTIMSLYILHEADVSKFVDTANRILKQHQQTRGSKLQEIRIARGFTQSDLSRHSGVSLRMIQLYEQRQNNISHARTDVVLRLAKTLGCHIEDLLEG